MYVCVWRAPRQGKPFFFYMYVYLFIRYPRRGNKSEKEKRNENRPRPRERNKGKRKNLALLSGDGPEVGFLSDRQTSETSDQTRNTHRNAAEIGQ